MWPARSWRTHGRAWAERLRSVCEDEAECEEAPLGADIVECTALGPLSRAPRKPCLPASTHELPRELPLSRSRSRSCKTSSGRRSRRTTARADAELHVTECPTAPQRACGRMNPRMLPSAAAHHGVSWPRPPSATRIATKCTLIRLHPPYTTPRGLPPSLRVTRSEYTGTARPNRPR